MFWLDERLFFLINGLATRSPTLDSFMQIVVGDHHIPMALAMTVFAMWFIGKDAEGRERNQRAVLLALLGVGLACAVVEIVNVFYFVPRPYELYPDVNLLFYRPTDSSFPSNPAAVSFAFTAGIFLKNRRASILPLILASIWCFARVYCGVHYPSDILGGMAIGILSVLLGAMILRLTAGLPTLILSVARRLYLA